MRRILLLPLLLVSLLGLSQTDNVGELKGDTLDVTGQTNPILSLDELDEQAGDQAVAGLLQSSRDVFFNQAGFNFSAARFRIRGMDGNNFSVMLNGVEMNDPEIGFAIWANWGGLNDLFRYPEVGVGISENNYNFGGLQGFSNIDLSAASQRAGTRVSYAYSNRTYAHRPMVTYATGEMADGWAVTASASARLAQEGYVEGTNYSNAAYFLAVDKKIDDKHTVGFIGLGSPSLRGLAGINTLENYEVRNDNYYNPYWGFQAGEKRNSRQRFSHKPIVMLWHQWNVDDKTSVKTTAFTQFGSFYQTRLDWVDANDPRPDYYRNLPSWAIFDGRPEDAAGLANQWANDPSFYQVNWDFFYQSNGKNLFTLDNAEGIEGNTVTGNRSKFVLERQHTDPFMIGVNTVLARKLGPDMNLHAGLNVHSYISDNYKVIDDLLGGDFWIDVNRFADGVLPGSLGANNDLQNPNNVVRLDERYGWNYKLHQRRAEFFAQVDGTKGDFDYFFAANLGYKSFWREGFFQNELFPDNSLGESERSSFTTGGVKGGLSYRISGRHFISGSAQASTRAPLLRNAFLSARSRNTLNPSLETEKLRGAELSYILRFPKLKGRITAYTSSIQDQTNILIFFDESTNELVNLITSDVDHLYQGIELGLEANVTPTWTVTAAYADGMHTFSDRPTVQVVFDELDQFEDPETAFLEGYRVGRTPQQALSIGATYRAPQFWFAGLNYSHFSDIWLSPIATRRTSDAVSNLIEADPQFNDFVGQTELEAGGALNFFGGKSWMFRKGEKRYFLLLTVNVTNVLDNTDFVTGGFEQGRPVVSNLDLFGDRLGYMWGRTYFAMLRLSF